MLEAASARLDVSRETLVKLETYQELVRQWSERINLVSMTDLGRLWQRHILDSAQLVPLSKSPERWIDLGSGGGFPGIVIAIILQQQGSGRVTLVESDKRKSAFLATVARTLGLDLEIYPERVQALDAANATTLSARALAPLDELVAHAYVHLAPAGTALFPKGRNWKSELKRTKERWAFDCEVVQSTTETDAAILKLQNIKRT